MDFNRIFGLLKIEPSEALESEVIEFKNFKDSAALFNSKDLCNEIVAFANTFGGHVIIGVRDSSELTSTNYVDQLVGFDNVDVDVTKERLLGRIKPKINLSITSFEFEKKKYLIISVQKNKNSLVSTSSGKVYVREGKSSVPAEPDQIQTLVHNLQTYDWSSQEIDVSDWLSLINKTALGEAKSDFCRRRGILLEHLDDVSFFESIGGTKNGILNYSGLLFLGTSEAIEKYLSNYEYRFSWKTANGMLLVNEVWNDCVWNSIKKVKRHFEELNKTLDFQYKANIYHFSLLDSQAFHEAFLNSVVHRDYSIDGMVSINYAGDELIITNPGQFYGGVNEENISFHEPRHRNKILAKLLMTFELVDRAGMGVLRIGLNSLKYGRDFPVWKQNLNNVEVRMPSEYIKPGIFVLTQNRLKDCSLTELLLLNKLHEVGFVSISELERDLKKKYRDPWKEIEKALNNEDLINYIELKANNQNVFITTTEAGDIALDVSRKFKATTNSEKHVKLFKHLKKHKSANNEEIKNLLKFSRASVTSNFLSKLEYLKNTGKSRSSTWSLK
ncbi:RNA-binding domain-containing protein [Sphingobacterium corticibacter]|uniref:Schlafen AlbA-2 domain-containing protein n=1 Tax=Sphingobacterium corticibacter TaxID=2171749 RepID=A0A2T8HIG6_9SPHI|nr:RNA-binding domain-containing protein [Sphingobacterium corticibacter]PVH25195.1 hypothetical protein DC487_09730 [Sphingobacterium corticibacter]